MGHRQSCDINAIIESNFLSICKNLTKLVHDAGDRGQVTGCNSPINHLYVMKINCLGIGANPVAIN